MLRVTLKCTVEFRQKFELTQARALARFDDETGAGESLGDALHPL